MKNIIIYLALAIIIIAGAVYFLGQPVAYVVMKDTQHIKGSGPVTITEFSDFQCPYCKAVQPTINQLLTEYEGKVRLEYKHFPLPSHAYSHKAAEASECAADHGKFWEYHDKLFNNQDRLYRNALIEYAAGLGLDADNFAACLDSGAMAERVNKDLYDGQNLGVRGTPAFFVNSRVLSGNQPISIFRSAINQELGA